MAIGTAAAIGLGLAGVGSAVGASSSKKAANRAADTSLQVAQQNNALAREIYGQNQQALSPFMQRGNAAGDQINALLGLAPANNNPAPANNNPAPNVQSYYSGANPAAAPWQGTIPNWAGVAPGVSFDGYGGYNALADYFARTTQPVGQPQPVPAAPPASQDADPLASQDDAFKKFRDSTGYQFRLGQGLDALNSGFAGSGLLQSGAALKAATEYGQNFASNEFGNYLGALQNQQGMGLSGASALAGVGQNYVGQVSGNNNSAGTAAANAALISGANNPFANVFGTLGGSILSGGVNF